jgi:hypothetical protein
MRMISWSGIEGPRWKRWMLVPYLLANSAMGRLRGNGILAVARAA